MKLTINCKNFILRLYRKSDAKSLATNINDRTISKNMSRVPYPYTLHDAHDWIRKTMAEYRIKKPTKLSLVIDIGGEVAGGISLNKIELGHKASIGYWLAKQFRGKGIMTKAVKEVSKFGFNKFKLRRIQAEVFLFNKRSVKVLKRAGFKYEGILRKGVKKGNRYIDVYLYAKIR